MFSKRKQKRIKAVKLADVINNIAGVPVSKGAKELADLWAKGEVSSLEMKERLIEAHRKA